MHVQNWECQYRPCAFRVWLVVLQVSTGTQVTFAIHRTETKEANYVLFSAEKLAPEMITNVSLRSMRFNLLK